MNLILLQLLDFQIEVQQLPGTVNFLFTFPIQKKICANAQFFSPNRPIRLSKGRPGCPVYIQFGTKTRRLAITKRTGAALDNEQTCRSPVGPVLRLLKGDETTQAILLKRGSYLLEGQGLWRIQAKLGPVLNQPLAKCQG